MKNTKKAYSKILFLHDKCLPRFSRLKYEICSQLGYVRMFEETKWLKYVASQGITDFVVDGFV